MLGWWCRREEWKTTASKAPFDLNFLESGHVLTPTGIRDAPVAETSTTDVFSWTRGDLVRVTRR